MYPILFDKKMFLSTATYFHRCVAVKLVAVTVVSVACQILLRAKVNNRNWQPSISHTKKKKREERKRENPVYPNTLNHPKNFNQIYRRNFRNICSLNEPRSSLFKNFCSRQDLQAFRNYLAFKMIDYENLEKWKISFYFFVVLGILSEDEKKHLFSR